MYERMLNKDATPAAAEMAAYCAQAATLFIDLNEWLSQVYSTTQNVSFPYGNHYGWCISHRKKKKLICNIFPEENAFSVMMRLSDEQFAIVYGQVQAYTQAYIDNCYACGDGGWIQYRVTCEEHFDDIRKLLGVKCV